MEPLIVASTRTRCERELAAARRALRTRAYPPPLQDTLRCLIASLEAQRAKLEATKEHYDAAA